MADWKELDEDMILNYEEAHTGMMHRYDRIMSRKMRDAIKETTDMMTESANAVGGAIDKAKNVMKNSIESMNERIDRTITSSDNMYRMTRNYSIVMACLTTAIAFSAIVQIIINWK